MTATMKHPKNLAVEFNPLKYSKRALSLIMAKSEQWDCKPSEAEARLLDELAKRKSQTAA